MAVMLMAVACDSVRVEQPGRYGEISVGLSELSVDVSTKASDGSYRVNLVNPEDETQNKETFLSDGESESFVVRYGTYSIYAEDCTPEEAAAGYGRMRIAGMTENVLLSDEAPLQNVNIECSVTNARVIVFYEETVLDKFEGLSVNLKSADGRSLDLPFEEASKDIQTWFNPTETFTYTVTGTYVGEDKRMEIEKSYSRALKAKDHIRITVRLVVPSGSLLPEVDFDVDIISTETSSGTFNPYI